MRSSTAPLLRRSVTQLRAEYAPASALGFNAFSPFSVRSVIAAAAAIPFEQVLRRPVPPKLHRSEGGIERLYSLKQEVVSAGVRAVLGIEMPVNPKRRFQDGAGSPRDRVTKTWCRNVFSKMWEERLRDTPDALDRRSGNEAPVTMRS